jgi:hypothetical protein
LNAFGAGGCPAVMPIHAQACQRGPLGADPGAVVMRFVSGSDATTRRAA